jgi:hypothetical protein
MTIAASVALLNKRADQVSRALSEQVESIISSYAARGFSEIGGPAVQQLTEAGSAAMQSLYEQATSIVPTVASADASGFVSAFDSALNSLALSAMSQAPDGSSPELSAKRQHLAHQLQLRFSQPVRGG